MNGTTPSTGESILAPEHRAYLNDHAVSDEVIAAQGIRSDGPVIVFPWRDGETETLQRRPWPGKAGEYFWVKGVPPHLNVIRDPGPAAPVLLAEGTKQSLAVASWAPPEYAVMGMPGCYGWTMSGNLDLSRFAGRQVLIMLDADAAENLDVYEAGEKLARELAMEDATAAFVPSPAWGKDGIDDYLARIAASRRADRITKLITMAQPVPAAHRPKTRKGHADAPETGDRVLVLVNRDRKEVIDTLTGALYARFWAELYDFGGALTRVRGAVAEPLEKGPFLALLPQAAACCKYRPATATAPARYDPDCWPDPQTIEAVLSSTHRFLPLSRVARMPFVRPDGTICVTPGYDEATRTLLVTSLDLPAPIPEHPDSQDVATAVTFLLDDWLGDMPFRDAPSRANALAMVLTPFIRGLVPIVPMGVISGLQPGVGKNLLADCLSVLVTGQTAVPMPYVDDEDETRKQITAAFRAGTDLFIFDEAHTITGHQLARAVTSITYQDRVLGVSKMIQFPNQVTWLALGNQVAVNADMARRVYFTELAPEGPNPQDREESAFTHPDLREWTAGHRAGLAWAVLTIIRAWYAAGRPRYSRGALMGSFEPWDKMLSGILHHAQVGGFLANLTERRAEADFSGGYWSEHVAWLAATFGTVPFSALDVRARAQASAGSWDAPPGLDDLADRGWARKLGQAYARNQDRWYGPVRLRKLGLGHGNVVKWVTETQDPRSPGQMPLQPTLSPNGHGPAGGTGGTGGTLNGSSSSGEPENPGKVVSSGGTGGTPKAPRTRARGNSTTESSESVNLYIEGAGVPPFPPFPPGKVFSQLSVGFDLETGDAGDLFALTPVNVSAGQAGNGRTEPGFVRLAGVISDQSDPVLVGVPDLMAVLSQAGEVYGHNILGFDGLALAWHHGLDWEAFAARARDTELIARQADPPRSRESGSSEDRYDLDHVAARLGVAGKTDELKRLKHKYGGYDKIPVDDPEYRSYLEGDLRATRAVAGMLHHDAYTQREHKLAAIAGRMTLTGFRVDQSLLEQRLEAGEERKRKALDELNASYGLPLSKTVTRGRGRNKHEEQEALESPLAADVGRAWLARVWDAFAITDPPRTDTGKLAIGGDDLAPVAAAPGCPAHLRRIIELMAIVTATRTVYQTAAGCLCADGRVHPLISMRQASGRWSVTSPGLTVFGKRGGRHIERDIFLPDEGHVLLSCDLAQVDMRAMAGHSQDPAYRELFLPGRDAHEEIALSVYGTKDRRQDAKAVGHGWNYGLGAGRMIKSGMDPVMVHTFIEGMEARFPRLIEWREQIRDAGSSGYLLDNGFGRRMRCDPSRAYTVAPALMGQGGARDIMCESLLRLPRELYPFLRVMVHDEIVMSVPEEDAAEIGQLVTDAMTWEWRNIPILCDLSKPGKSWGEVSAK